MQKIIADGQCSVQTPGYISIQVRMYYGSETDGRCCIRYVCTHQVAALFCV